MVFGLRRAARSVIGIALGFAVGAALFPGPAAGAQGYEAAAPVVPQLGERTLGLGSWGADVFMLQQALVRAGYELNVDGHFGRATQRAVMAFQLAHNLRPDGIAGPATITALQSLRPTTVYVVQQGDSLAAIAARYGVTVEELSRLNGLRDSLPPAGTRLVIPVPRSYTVRPGDTLSHIAARFGTTVASLARLNGIENPDLLYAGTTLTLPSAADEAWSSL